MSQNEQDKKAKKEAMKKLRESRKVFIKAASAKMKAHKKVIGAIKDQLKDGARTVPEIAAASGHFDCGNPLVRCHPEKIW